jgi:hypothetical protein
MPLQDLPIAPHQVGGADSASPPSRAGTGGVGTEDAHAAGDDRVVAPPSYSGQNVQLIHAHALSSTGAPSGPGHQLTQPHFVSTGTHETGAPSDDGTSNRSSMRWLP